MSITTEIQQCQDEAREGWMPEKKSAPDFGEPWKLDSYNSPLGDSGDFEGVLQIYTREHQELVAEAWNPEDKHYEQFSRIIACVNACAGMADPAAEIQAMREAIREAHEALKELRSFYLDMTGLPPCAANASLAKLQPFLKP